MRQVCPACNYVHFVNPKVAAVVFIEHDDRILLVKRGVEPARGKWALIAGFVDEGETPQEAAIREAHEEVGIRIVIDRLIDVGFETANNTITILFAAHTSDEALKPDDDVEGAAWFRREDAIPDLGFASTHRLVSAWLAHNRSL
jgi:ADP-ribose pyrophosphatase YjhB (NUDIX family)